MARKRKPPGGAGRTKRLRKKLLKWLWSQQPGLPSGLFLYHGTSDLKYPLISESGLRPRGNRPSEWTGQASHPEMVYITDSYPHVFGVQTGRPITAAFEIDVRQLDPRRLYPDEDYLVQKHLVAEAEGMTLHDVAKSKLRQFQGLWRDSLGELGTCCYHGRIPPSAFLAITVFNRAANFDLATFIASHTVGIEDHSANGTKYRIVNKWIFARCGIKGDPFSREGITHIKVR